MADVPMSSAEGAMMSNALKAWRFLYKRGYIEGFGHLSFRLPGSARFLLTRHSLGFQATADDFIVMDLDGRKLDGEGEPPGEYPIHVEILRARPDVGSIIHYHGLYSTAFTTSEQALKPIHLWARSSTTAYRFFPIRGW
jgi:ribulose-5-phosphate 4-epimerase/fuculose-1-phosphate aldolase